MEAKLTNQNLEIPVIGLGTWGIGGLLDPDYSNDEESVQSIVEAIEMGYTHIDTAALYGGGHTEELIGRAIHSLDRSKLIITSKVWKTDLKYDNVIESCKKSLESLRTDFIDMYLIHAPNPEIPIEETMNAMDDLVDQKLINYIGFSNFTVSQMQEATRYTKNKIIASQIPYNLATRDINLIRSKNVVGAFRNMESEIVPYCQENDIAVMAYRPIERGFLLEPNPLLDRLERKYDKSKTQIALNWLISKPNVVVIPKSINKEHLKENLGAAGWQLDNDDIEQLNKMKFDT